MPESSSIGRPAALSVTNDMDIIKQTRGDNFDWTREQCWIYKI